MPEARRAAQPSSPARALKETKSPPNVPAQKHACNTQQNGNDEYTRIEIKHKDPGNLANNQTRYNQCNNTHKLPLLAVEFSLFLLANREIQARQDWEKNIRSQRPSP